MAIKKRIITIILIAVVTIIALSVPAWFYVSDKLSRPDSYKDLITKTVSENLNRNVNYETGKAALTFRNGLSLQLTNLVITEKDRVSSFLNVKNVYIRVNIIPLLRNRLVFGEVILNQPRVSLKRDSAGVLNIADLLTKKEDDKTPKFRKIVIENGLATFLDQASGTESLSTSLENLNGRINALFWTNTYRFHIKTSVIEGKNKAELATDGFFSSASSEKPFYESKVRASVNLKGTDLKHYVSYLKKYTTVKQLAGVLNLDMKFSGKFSDFKSKGTVVVKNVSLDYPGVFNGNIRPRMIQVDYSLKRDTESLKLDIGHLAVDNFNANGSFDIDDLDKKDPLLKASAITKVFSLKEVRPYVPWGIIQDDVASFIQEYIKDGNFRLVEGKLKGRLSQITNINTKESVDVVSILAEVDKGVLEVDSSAPVFHDISGIMELKKREFSLKKMKGRFGNSPCTMEEGSISDFARPEPNIYTADMKIQPARNEVLWLLGKEKFRDSSFKGTSLLLLSGKGTDDDFHVDASWDLTDAAYVYPDVLEKPKARKNHITAKIVINDDAVNFTSFKYYLPPVNVTAAALFRFSGKIPLSFNIQSKTFDVREAVPILPALRTYKPVGNCSLALAGRGDLSNPASIQWNGNVSLSNISIQPSDSIKPLKGLTGKAIFKGSSMETSLLKGRIGESDIQGNFKVDDLSKPKTICQFNTNVLQTKDLGLRTPEGNLNLYAIKGKIGVKDKIIHVDNLSFVLGESSFNLSGDVSDLSLPKITVALTSPYVKSDDFARLFSLEYPKKEKDASSAMELNATLRIDEGKLSDIEFKKLYAGLKYSHGILDLETLEADLFDGKFKAKGKVSINSDGKNHYETNISINKISLEKIQSYLKIGDRTITGKLSISGDLSATGSDSGELKKTAAGTFEVRADKGVLKKFSVLSKIFSILNIFQLAKLHLPDMATGGMPYRKITFHTSLKEGVLSSEDFFIESYAMQISGSGKVDFLKKKLDYIIGIHPLQSLDLIVAKIPIAGWIITDERGKLFTVHFKIDGTWDNPNVTTINAQSIGKGTLDIFRRIFLLPEKLITNTGEVILGH